MRTIWWIKRDMRLSDNDAILSALGDQAECLPLFIIEPSILKAEETGAAHVHAQITALEQLRSSLQKLGADVLFARGEADEVLKEIHHRWPFDRLHSHEETGSLLTFERDKRVLRLMQSLKVKWVESHQNGVIRRLQRREDRQSVIRERLFNTQPSPSPSRWSFPDFWREPCRKRGLLGQEEGPPLDGYNPASSQMVSELDGQKDLKSFLGDRSLGYRGGISSPNLAFHHGSRLSPHLAWGTVSLRQAFRSTYDRLNDLDSEPKELSGPWKRSLLNFLSRLHWHDHFIQRLESAPNSEKEALNPAYRELLYDGSEENFQRWTKGETGFPLIDACLRCVRQTGFLNFRMRAMVVTFACFAYRLPWTKIHLPLGRWFKDYEPGIHFSQVQMQASVVGINAMRVYNPTKQMADQDPEGTFVRKWIPELKEHPWEEVLAWDGQENLGDYPAIAMDFKAEVKIMKDRISQIRKSEEGKRWSDWVLEHHGSRKKRR